MLKTIGSPLHYKVTIRPNNLTQLKFNYYLFLNSWLTLNLKNNSMQTCKLHIMQFLN